MARIKYSALVSDMRNKLNGSVLSKNRYGSYVRNKVTPVNPQTARQVFQRSLLASMSQAWKGLTEAQRVAWRSAVELYQTTNIFGDIQKPSGNILFNRLNMNILNAGGTQINVPPLPIGADQITQINVAVTVAGGVYDVAFAPTVPAGHAMILEATPGVSAGISNANNQFRQVAVAPAGTTSPFDMSAEYIATFGAPAVGQKVFVRAKLVRLTTGEVSQALKNETFAL